MRDGWIHDGGWEPEPWKCPWGWSRWKEGDRGESGGSTGIPKIRGRRNGDSRGEGGAFPVPSGISEMTMMSLLVHLESLLQIWGHYPASHTELLFSLQREWEDACLQNCSSLKNNFMAVSTKMGLAFNNYVVKLMNIDSRRGYFRPLSLRSQKIFFYRKTNRIIARSSFNVKVFKWSVISLEQILFRF